MRTYLLCSVLVLALVLPASSDDFVCEDTHKPGKWRRYILSIDPTTLKLHGNEQCTVVAEANVPDQRAKNVGDPGVHPPVPPTIPQKYRKVAAGLTVEMDTTEKQAVDGAIQEAQDEQQTYVDEAQGPTCKYASLDDITTKVANQRALMQPHIDAVSDINNLKTELTWLMDQLMKYIENLARCDLSHVKARQ